ncbi:major facilitator superfamily domain-containing protein [Fennellomyces sp. T-0311]|nr:major facilitator superfamily domain-containing protein [Fennellomyces sp. T-0311]
MGYKTINTSSNDDMRPAYLDDAHYWNAYIDEHRPLLQFKFSKHDAVRDYETKEDLDDDSDPRYKWVIVVAAFLGGLQFNGFSCCWGVFQDYYQREEFGKSNSVVMQLSFIGALLPFLPCVFIIPSEMIISRIQMKGALIAVSILVFLGLTLAAFSTQIWQLCLSLGLCTATGLAVYYTACVRVIPQWFTKNSGTAFGIVTSSCAASGLVFPPMIAWAAESLGIRWTFLILSLVFTTVNIVNCVLIKERPAVQQEEVKDSGLSIWKLFKNRNFILWAAIATLRGAADLIPTIYLPSYATHIGLSPMQGAAILSGGAIMGMLGSISSGFVADWIGNVNTLILYTVFSVQAVFYVWMDAVTFNALLLFMMLCAFFGNAFFVLILPISYDVAVPTQESLTFAVATAGCGIGMLVGPIIPSAIEATVDAEPYMSHRWICVIAPTIATVLCLILKLRLRRGFFAKV